jgi:hypothetical protein
VDNPKIVRVVTSGFPQFVQRVNVYDTVLEHISEKHPEEFSRINEIYSTIEGAATRIHQSRTNERAIVLVNDDCVSTGGDPIRVPVKVYDDGIGIMSTANFTGSKDQGELLWSRIDDK